MTAPPAQSVIMHQPRTILAITTPKRTAPEIHLGGFAGAVVAKGLASAGKTRVAAHVRRTRRTSGQQQRASDHHDFDEVGDHFSVPLAGGVGIYADGASVDLNVCGNYETLPCDRIGSA